MKISEDELVELLRYNNVAEEKKIELILENSNIPYWNKSFRDTAYNGLYTMYHGLGKIMVFKKDFEKAVNIIKKNNLAMNS